MVVIVLMDSASASDWPPSSGECSRRRSPSAALARLSGGRDRPTDVLIHGVGGARRLCGHLLEVNIRKVPKLADIVASRPGHHRHAG